MCKHWKLFLHPDIGMSAPPPYLAAPIVTPSTSTVSTLARFLSSRKVEAFEQEKGRLVTNVKAFELWPLPAGVTVERIYEGTFR